MLEGYHLIPFTADKMDDCLKFAHENPSLPKWTQEDSQKFIEQLTSSSELVFILRFEEKYACVAVLLDKITNKGNHANLEIIGIDERRSKVEILDFLLPIVKKRLPYDKLGVELTLHESFQEQNYIAKKHSFNPYYNLYEMENDKPTQFQKYDPEFTLSTDDDCKNIYHVLVESFKDNVEISIPDLKNWELSYKQNKGSKTWLARHEGKIIGFLRATLSQEKSISEIETIGVLQEMRRKGIARRLLQHALAVITETEIPCCKLVAATQNISALNLYSELGFEKKECFHVYCWQND